MRRPGRGSCTRREGRAPEPGLVVASPSRRTSRPRADTPDPAAAPRPLTAPEGCAGRRLVHALPCSARPFGRPARGSGPFPSPSDPHALARPASQSGNPHLTLRDRSPPRRLFFTCSRHSLPQRSRSGSAGSGTIGTTPPLPQHWARRTPPSDFQLRHFRREVWPRCASERGASEANSARGSPGGRCRL